MANLARLKTQLLTSGLQQKDNPLWQVINQLINQIEILDKQLNGVLVASSTSTTILGNISSPGISGDDGADGEIGPPGIRGIDGISGPSGPTTIGPMGIDGTDGEDSWHIPGVQGIQGIAGISGPSGPITIGPMGIDGIDGEDGVIGFNGRSVQIYEQAIEPIEALPGDFWITPA